jgi:hypothetical protein
MYLDGGARRSVCELCRSRAVAEGWVLEGTIPPYDERGASPERRRGFLTRLRTRRESAVDAIGGLAGADELDGRLRRERSAAEPAPMREPRHVRAVPTNAEHKVASAIEAFNVSEHPRTVAGVARSLGLPIVAIRPSESHSSIVDVVVAWELCWYRYEVDLADELQSVRVCAQGTELEELTPEQRQANAVADEYGSLALAS